MASGRDWLSVMRQPTLSLTALEAYTLTVLGTARQMAVTRDEVVRTAIRLLDEVGLTG